MNRVSHLLLAFFLAVLASSLVGQAAAHALPVRSDPSPNASLSQSPSQVTVWFSEPLSPGSPPGTSSHLKVLDSNGNQADNKDLQFSLDYLSMWVTVPTLPKGVYTVAWQSVSVTDGHLASGSFPFGIRVVVPPPPSAQPGLQPSLVSLIPEGAIRWTYYSGVITFVGGSFFYFLILTPLFLRRRTATSSNATTNVSSSTVGADQTHSVQLDLRTRVLVVSVLGAVVCLLGLAGLLLNQANNGGASSLQSFVFGTQLGLVDMSRIVLVAASAVVLALGAKINKPYFFYPPLLLGLAVLFLTSLVGHNAAVGGSLALTATSILADWFHLVGVSVWIGGLVHFVGITPTLKRNSQLHSGMLRLVPRFSRISILAVGIIIISGLYATLFQVGSFAALLGTEYGQTLLVKISLVGALVFIGGTNQLFWYPRLTSVLKTLGGTHPQIGRLSNWLSRSIRLQVVTAIILILTVGFLTALPTAIQVNQTINRPSLQATTFSQSTNGANVGLSIYPFHVGQNSFLVTATDSAGNTLNGIREVRLDFNYKDSPQPTESENQTRPNANGQWVIDGQDLNRAGHWDITVTVLRTNQPDTITYLTIYLPQYPGLDTAKVYQVPYPDTNFNGWATLIDGQGNIWFSVPTAGTTTPSIGRYSPSSNSFQMFSPPYASPSPGPMSFDSKGKIWYENQLPIGSTTLDGSIGSFDPSTGKFSPVILLPYSNNNWQGGGLTVDSHDIIWITDSSDSRLLAFNQTAQPSPGQWIALNQTSGAQFLKTPEPSSDLSAITVDQANGDIWFVGDAIPLPNAAQSGHGGGGVGKIEMYNQTSRTIKNYVPLSPNSTLLVDVTVASNGDVWFAAHGSNSLGKISPPYGNSSITITSLNPFNPGAFPWGLKFDPQGNLWFSEHVANTIGFYNLGTNQFQEFPIPISQGNPADAKFIALDQYGNVWFAEGQGGNLGVLALQPKAIGLGGQTSDFYYEVTVGILIVIVAVTSLRWQRIVRFFSRRGTHPAVPTKTGTAKPQLRERDRKNK